MIADRYRLERKVGGGRVSAVWRVHDQVTDGTCAVKLLHRSMHKHSEALTRFSLEDRLARELTGPHFPERVGSGSWEGMRYIAWRWHEGESLRALFDRNPKQDAPTVYSIVQETCQALTGVHAAGYTHGDLKPENLFFADRGENDPARQLKLIGFGVASRIVPFAAASAIRKRPGQLVGTPLYMSPDLILGRMPKGGQADLWALAVLVYEALTGRAPFLGADLGSVLEAILKKDAPRPSGLADNLPGTFDLWWVQALEQEFSTPAEFATSLARALGPALRSSHTQRSASLPERLPSSVDGSVAGPSGVVSPSAPAPVHPPSAPPALGATLLGTGSSPPASRASSDAVPAMSAPRGPSSSVSSNANGAAAVASPTSITSSGLGRAAASSPATSSPSIAVSRTLTAADMPEAALSSPPRPAEREKFTPYPSPLRDFSAAASRKTLVGITPPTAPSAPSAAITTAPLGSPFAIEGAPCRSIETSAVITLNDAAQLSPEGRRPSHPTVPFPRPRLLPRLPALESERMPTEAGVLGNTWRGPTTRTLRFVLASGDHKPQRIAAVLVCAAAALVIFVLGRSPVSGTAAIGQSTNALSAEREAAAQGSAPAAPHDPNLAAPTSAPSTTGDDAVLTDERSAPAAPVDGAGGMEGKELAPGLIVPSAPKDATERAPKAAKLTPAPPPPRSTPSATPRAAPEPMRAPRPKAAPPPSSPNGRARPEPKLPSKKLPALPPPSKGGDFDFGI